ncbi:MAG: ATP synthase F1 subunit delta [Chitinophagales bacterium]
MSDQKLSARYAKSLIDLAQEKNQLDAINNDIRLFDGIMKSSREFLLMLRNPIINADKKLKIVEQIFKDKVNPITYAFFELVIRKGRESHLPGIVSGFIDQYNRLKQILRVKVTTAIPVDDKLVNHITQLVKEKTGLETMELQTAINPELIGGYILQFEDSLYDASVLRSLEVIDDNFDENIYRKKF